jgi:hypothetical protein
LFIANFQLPIADFSVAHECAQNWQLAIENRQCSRDAKTAVRAHNALTACFA